MKKYKLIKEYPESSPKGTVFVAHNEINAVFQAEGGAVIYYSTIEKYSEYFEEVKEEKLWGVSTMKEEPNYLITAFREVGNLFGDNRLVKIGADGKYGNWFTLEGMLKDPPCVESGDFEIYSVKNSKGEEFTIGDNVFFLPKNSLELFKIDNFFINKDGILLARSSQERYAICEDINTIAKEIKVPHKVKSPIYTTTDGVDIKEGSCFTAYLLNKDLSIVKPFSEVNISRFSKQDAEVASRYLTFTSEENRDKYIKENSKKPIFVSADGKDMYEGDTVWHFCDELDFQLSSSIVRKNNIYGDIRFSTEEKAREYIDNNKPKYSLADIEKAYESPKDSPLFKSIIKNLKALGK